MKECYLYRQLKNGSVQCRACCHYCLIKNGAKGKCSVRENRNGKLYSLVYNQPCALEIDPIEKKPLYLFLPGSKTLSLATVGCNFSCLNCQNWTISQLPKMGLKIQEKFQEKKRTPFEIVKIALKNKLPSISYTYTEPTIFLEYALDTMKLAKKAGLKNIWITNAFFSEETFNLIKNYLDAANVDLKSFDERFYREICQGELKPVLENLKRIKKANIWLEITTLVIPQLNDSPQNLTMAANFIKKELGAHTPWHLSRFFASISWRLKHLSDTPLETLEMAAAIGKKAGLKNVFIGNV